MCGIQLKGRKLAKKLMLGLNEIIDQFTIANSICWYGHVLRREDGHVLRRALQFKVEGERDTNISNLVISRISEGGQIHLNPAAILFMPTLQRQYEQQSASFLLKPTFIHSSKTCFFHVLFGLPFFL